MKYFTSLIIFVSVTFPSYIFAAEDEFKNGLVTCKDGGTCNYCNFVDMVQMINLWLLLIVGFIAVILFAYAGYRITASRGDVGIVTEGRKMIGNVAIGIFIMILATTLIDTIMKVTTGDDNFGVWNKPTNCGIQETPKSANPVEQGLETHTGVTVSNSESNNDGYGTDPLGEFGNSGGTNDGGTNDEINNGYGNDPLGEFGNSGGTNDGINNGYGNDPYGEFGNGTSYSDDDLIGP